MEIIDVLKLVLSGAWVMIALAYFIGDARPDNRWIIPMLMLIIAFHNFTDAVS